MADTIHNVHGVIGLSNHESGMIVAGYLALFKFGVAMFFFIPWLAIWFVLNKSNKRIRLK